MVGCEMEDERDTSADPISELDTVLFQSMGGGEGRFESSGGVKYKLLGSLEAPGPIAFQFSSSGSTRERERFSAASLTWRKQNSSALAGWQWVEGDTYLTFAVGPELARERGPCRCGSTQLGARALLEIWTRPAPDLAFSATLTAGTARPSAWARAALGYALFEGVHVGPEVTVAVEEHYREARIGLQLDGLAVGFFTLRASAGFAWTTDGRASLFYNLGSYMKI